MQKQASRLNAFHADFDFLNDLSLLAMLFAMMVIFSKNWFYKVRSDGTPKTISSIPRLKVILRFVAGMADGSDQRAAKHAAPGESTVTSIFIICKIKQIGN